MSELYWRKSEDCGLWAAAIDNAGVSAGGVCSAVAPPVPPPPLVLGSPGEHFNEYYAGNDSDSDGTCSPWVSWPPYSESDRIEIRCEKELAPPFRVARRLSSLYSPYRELRLLHASVGGVPRFATPADSLLCIAHTESYACCTQVWAVSLVQSAIFCRPVPNRAPPFSACA